MHIERYECYLGILIKRHRSLANSSSFTISIRGLSFFFETNLITWLTLSVVAFWEKIPIT